MRGISHNFSAIGPPPDGAEFTQTNKQSLRFSFKKVLEDLTQTYRRTPTP